MNLYQLNINIDRLEKEDDLDKNEVILNFYIKRRDEILAEIAESIRSVATAGGISMADGASAFRDIQGVTAEAGARSLKNILSVLQK